MTAIARPNGVDMPGTDTGNKKGSVNSIIGQFECTAGQHTRGRRGPDRRGSGVHVPRRLP